MFTKVVEYTWGMPFDYTITSRTSQQLTAPALGAPRTWTIAIPTNAMCDGQHFYAMEVLHIETAVDFRAQNDPPVPSSAGQSGWNYQGAPYDYDSLKATDAGNPTGRWPRQSDTHIRVEYSEHIVDPILEGQHVVLASFDRQITTFCQVNPNDSDVNYGGVITEEKSDCTDGAGTGTLVSSPFIYGNIIYTNTYSVDDAGNGLPALAAFIGGFVRVRTRIRYRTRQVTKEDFFGNK